MKKLLFYFIALFLSVNFYSCSKDDEVDTINPDDTIVLKTDNYNENVGKDNLTDVAVTGGVLQVSTTSCDFLGYVNINAAATDASNLTFGVEVSKEDKFDNPQRFDTDKLLNNREIKINVLNRLNEDTKYYYRTYVYNGKFYTYGQVHTFTTKILKNASKVEEIFACPSSSTVTIYLGKTAEAVQFHHDEKWYYGIAYTTNEKKVKALKAEIAAGNVRVQELASEIFKCELVPSSENALRINSFKPYNVYYYVPITATWNYDTPNEFTNIVFDLSEIRFWV